MLIWIISVLFLSALVYFAWIGIRVKGYLRDAARQRNELRRSFHEVTTERAQLLGQVEQVTAFCRQLANAPQRSLVYQSIIQQLSDILSVDSEPLRISLWRNDPALYSFILEASKPEAKEWLLVDRFSLKDLTLPEHSADQSRAMVMPHMPEVLKQMVRKSVSPSEAMVLIPLYVEGNVHAVVLALCSSEQIVALQRNMRLVNLLALHSAMVLGNLVHRELAMTDHLTRLWKFVYFQEQLAQELQRCYRFELPLSLMLIDIDEFKEINDSHGHQAGDWALLTTAQIIKRSLRAVDLAARYGGDEFIVMLPETGKGNDPDGCEAVPVAQRIRKAVDGHPFDLQGNKLQMSVSIGVSIRLPQAPVALDAAALFKEADVQLYRAKRSGRNRCAFQDGPILGPD